jgi:uncharacterized protein YktA (UPF0223 family)
MDAKTNTNVQPVIPQDPVKGTNGHHHLPTHPSMEYRFGNNTTNIVDVTQAVSTDVLWLTDTPPTDKKSEVIPGNEIKPTVTRVNGKFVSIAKLRVAERKRELIEKRRDEIELLKTSNADLRASERAKDVEIGNLKKSLSKAQERLKGNEDTRTVFRSIIGLKDWEYPENKEEDSEIWEWVYEIADYGIYENDNSSHSESIETISQDPQLIAEKWQLWNNLQAQFSVIDAKIQTQRNTSEDRALGIMNSIKANIQKVKNPKLQKFLSEVLKNIDKNGWKYNKVTGVVEQRVMRGEDTSPKYGLFKRLFFQKWKEVEVDRGLSRDNNVAIYTAAKELKLDYSEKKWWGIKISNGGMDFEFVIDFLRQNNIVENLIREKDRLGQQYNKDISSLETSWVSPTTGFDDVSNDAVPYEESLAISKDDETVWEMDTNGWETISESTAEMYGQYLDGKWERIEKYLSNPSLSRFNAPVLLKWEAEKISEILDAINSGERLDEGTEAYIRNLAWEIADILTLDSTSQEYNTAIREYYKKSDVSF